MRATLGTTYRTLQAQINTMGNRLNDLRQITASGKKINKPSDDPSAINPVLSSRARIRANDRYLKTTGLALDRLNIVETELDQIENIFVRAKEIAINSVNGSMNDQNLNVLADNISQLKDELLAAANTKVNGKYIFAGFEEETLPFTANPAYNPLDPLSLPMLYNGDENPTTLEISPGESIAISLTGNELFLGDANNDGAVDPGNVDMFEVLTRLEDAIRTNNTIDIEAQLDSLDTAIDQGGQLLGRIGNNAQRVESAIDQLENSQIDVKEILSRYEDADLIETIANLTQQGTAFEAALKVVAQVSQLSILNYM